MPQRELALTRDPARQLQIGKVRATNQQKKSDPSHEGEERLVDVAFDVAEQLLPERDNPDAPTTAKVRVLLFELAGDRFQLRVRLFYGHTRLQSRDNFGTMRGAFPQRQALDRGLKRHPNFGPAREIKSRRQHSYDVVAATIQLEGLSNDSAASGEMLLPKCVADERHGRAAGSVFFRSKCATEHRCDSQCR